MAHDPQRNVFWYADLLIKWKIIKRVGAWIFGIVLFALIWNTSSKLPPQEQNQQPRQTESSPTAPPAN